MKNENSDQHADELANNGKQDDAESDTHPGVVIRNAFGIAALMWIGIALLMRSCSG